MTNLFQILHIDDNHPGIPRETSDMEATATTGSPEIFGDAPAFKTTCGVDSITPARLPAGQIWTIHPYGTLRIGNDGAIGEAACMSMIGTIIMAAIDRVRRSVDIIFLTGMLLGMMTGIATIILSKLG
ncbi:hypothetical protein [Sphingobium aquiterrae]|uniref:hypothetical protein n=1 Tax=Sphingobium aquiterrae TaxID=2038656 RepID=UPI003017C075